MLPELCIVRLIDPEKLDLRVLFERPDRLLPQHTVLDEGDEGADILQVALGRIAVLDALVDAGEHRGDTLLIREERKRSATALPAAVLDYAGTDAVDGAELEALRHLCSETAREACRHVLRRRHRIGYRQDPLRRDALTVDHIAEPRDEHRRFTGARHRQKEHRALDRLHGALLLLIQLYGKAVPEFGPGHHADVFSPLYDISLPDEQGNRCLFLFYVHCAGLYRLS